MGAWLSRFKDHPLSCAGHIVWGGIGGWIGGIDGAVVAAGGVAYQFGSAWRKSAENNKPDSVGNDAFDYPVGYLIGRILRKLYDKKV